MEDEERRKNKNRQKERKWEAGRMAKRQIRKVIRVKREKIRRRHRKSENRRKMKR